MSRWIARLERIVEVTEQAQIAFDLEDDESMTPAQVRQWAIDEASESGMYLDDADWHTVDSDAQEMEVLWAKEVDS